MSAAAIRALNDAYRVAGPRAGDWNLTRGVLLLGPAAVAQVISEVQQYSDFGSHNDPYGEHDFGSFKIGEETLFWKIDYYDRSLTAGSEDPTDPILTRRVMTVMLVSEY